MTCRPRAQVDYRAGNVFGLSKSFIRVGVRKLLDSTRQRHQAIGHFRREEPRSDTVAEDAARPKLDGQISSEMQCCSFGSTVSRGGVLPKATYPNTRDRCGDKYP